MGEGDAPCDEEYGDGGHEGPEEEAVVADLVAEPAARHARQHHAQIGQRRTESVVGHFVRSGRHLLHDEERKAHEPESVAEIFEDDAAADQQGRRGLEPGQQGVDHERDVEDRDERKQRPPQFEPRDEVAAQDRTHDECDHAERAVVEADLLFGQAETLIVERGVEKQRNDLDDQPLGEAVEDDEGDVDADVPFPEESAEDGARLAQRLADAPRMGRGFAARRQHPQVVDSQQEEQRAAERHDDHPRLDDPDPLLERSGQIDQPAHGEHLGDVVERPLPADVFRLGRRR